MTKNNKSIKNMFTFKLIIICHEIQFYINTVDTYINYYNDRK